MISDVRRKLRQIIKKNSTVHSAVQRFGKSRMGTYLKRILTKVYTGLNGISYNNQPYSELQELPAVPEAVEGRIQISLYKERADDPPTKLKDRDPLVHTTTWVNGPGYNGMEDNDLRGFLDGRFIYPWNQPGQIHVRLGRRHRTPKVGEWELFRVLQRWEQVWLPEGTTVVDARLEVDVEEQVDNELEVLLYEVHKDWNPGSGGIRRDNNGRPQPGEVWWNEAVHGTRCWGLPGVGFASDNHPDADTPITPLARVKYEPGDKSLIFSSEALASYIQRRVATGSPLLFLLKLSDYLEDVPGSLIKLYSGNHGDSRNPARRPRLILNWECINEDTHLVRDILLEHGRSLVLPALEGNHWSSFAVSFEPKVGTHELPTIFAREGSMENNKRSNPVLLPRKMDQNQLVIQIDAGTDPIQLGQRFMAELKDTWVRTAPPEEQEVPWTFYSPSGKDHTVQAVYKGDFRWEVLFKPEELGRWQYQWTQNFTEVPYKSAKGYFDVVAGSLDEVKNALNQLIQRINASELPVGEPRTRAFGSAFYRLQREVMRYTVPENYPLNEEDDGGELGKLMDNVREAIAGKRPRGGRLKVD